MIEVKHKFNRALNTPMDRKQFMLYVGMLFLTIFGITKLLHFPDDMQTQNPTHGGYGYTPFGDPK